MKLFKLTALATFCLALTSTFTSCEKDSEKDKVNAYSKSDIPVTGAQVAPVASPTTGSGSLSVSYDKRVGIINYNLTWSGLSDSVIAIRVCGPAPVGYPVLNPSFTGANPTGITTTPYVVLQEFNGVTTQAPTKAFRAASGSYTGTLLVDGVKVREQDLLNGLYFITVHTKTTLPVSGSGAFLYRWFGEIRGQIRFD